MNRRQPLKALAAATFVAGAGPVPARSATTPSQQEGPFYPVDRIALRADLLKRDGRQAAGTAMGLSGQVTRSGVALAGVRVEIWQCDAQGVYRHPAMGQPVDAGFEGFGAQTTDAQGRYRFLTLLPVPYEPRPPHIHFKLWLGGQPVFITQAYLEGQTAEGGAFGRLAGLFSSKDGLSMRPLADEKGLLQARFDIVLG